MNNNFIGFIEQDDTNRIVISSHGKNIDRCESSHGDIIEKKLAMIQDDKFTRSNNCNFFYSIEKGEDVNEIIQVYAQKLKLRFGEINY